GGPPDRTREFRGEGRGPGGPNGNGAPPDGFRRGGNPMDQAFKDLNLPEDQQAKVDSIRREQQQKSRGLMPRLQQGEIDREGMMAEMKKLNDAMMSDLKSVLTEDQY